MYTQPIVTRVQQRLSSISLINKIEPSEDCSLARIHTDNPTILIRAHPWPKMRDAPTPKRCCGAASTLSWTNPSMTEPDIRDLVQDLVRTPSVNPSIAPEGSGETAIASFACEWLNARGVRAWQEEAAPGRPNAVAEVGNSHGPTLAFCAHLDTVGVEGMEAPFSGDYKNGCVYGRGAFDMKGSAAAIMAAAVDLSQRDWHGRALLALVADEEYASIGAMDFV